MIYNFEDYIAIFLKWRPIWSTILISEIKLVDNFAISDTKLINNLIWKLVYYFINIKNQFNWSLQFRELYWWFVLFINTSKISVNIDLNIIDTLCCYTLK